ncbi:cell division protein FtsQ/DivIB [Phenylobacterium sp.]|uniref:cell division protein FtsQ/DivIB n=1 Tax=Phenylobacterium sp. TaxID=1871053 RepID=UPI0037C8C5A0
MRGGTRGASQTKAKTAAKPAPRARAAEADRVRLSPARVLMLSGGVLTLALAAVLLTGGRGAHVVQMVQTGVDGHFGQAGFQVRAVHVEGASPMARADIIRAAGVHDGQPLLGLDLAEVRARVEKVGWVQEAHVVRLLPDTLVLSVKERRQLAVWQHRGRTVVIDADGRPIPEADPGRFSALPLVVGAGGDQHAGEILPILVQRPRLMARMEALVRVDDRRWDLRLKDGGLIQLPAADEEAALMRLETLDLRSRILDLGFERIDLRNPDTIAVRPRAPAPLTAPAETPAPTPAEDA